MKKVLLTGATGYVGHYVGCELVKDGYEVYSLTRDVEKAKKELSFPSTVVDLEGLSKVTGINGVVHLAGASIADKRWSSSYKKIMYTSRVDFTKKILEVLDTQALKSWVQMSATGYYREQNHPQITEASGLKSEGFLGDLVNDWEEATKDLDAKKITLRMGMVIGPQSHALEKMIPLFRKNIGAVLGSGKQYMPWIHINDAVDVILRSLADSSYSGVYNLTSPELVQNKAFTYALASRLGVKVLLPPAPKFSLRILYGEMADVLLNSLPVYPKNLIDKGFKFKFESLKEALEDAVPKLQRGECELVRTQWIPEKLESAFEFFKDEKNLEEITPPYLNFKVLNKSTEKINKGTLLNYKLKLKGIPFKWRTEIATWNPPFEFSDHQLKGPYTKWHHKHTFSELGSGTYMTDRVVYKVPLGLVGRIFASKLVKSDVTKIFDYRKEKIHSLYSS